ncbi:sodium:solute symporter [Coraliomargarita sp. SDUM461004]|uniref:Sodium:solute symporter n=1 Tax=Thalassobacterium sedimentorum TaxID=3041258 RepID=A0ABU1AJG2_9BACT|nr:sodium:solute symporter [Coraliomargarita sp. SDUM461004]MDQ8194940.1 sodium:solute symporter [Coraliomargarita sp. SDUM461004]
MKLQIFDIIVIGLYFACMLGIGYFVSKRNKDTEDYFLGGRNIPGWAIGVSFVGTMISSVTFLALPADAFKTAWIRFLPNFAFPVVTLIAAYVFLPFFRRGTISSAYQYLGLRFGSSIATYGACVYIGAQVVRSSSIVYLMALLMSTMTGLSIDASIVVSGAITAFYTVKGGFEAVVWTDVIQTIILVMGALIIIGMVILSLPGGMTQIITEGWAAGKFAFNDLDIKTGELASMEHGFSLSEKTTVMLLLVGFTQFLTGKLNQETVQRWCSTSSIREARKSMWILGGSSLPIWGAFMFMGTSLWVYYQHFPDTVSAGVLDGTLKSESILPHFIVTEMPVGLAGLVIAGALAAAMSTLSSSINSTSMVIVNDIYQPLIKKGVKKEGDLRVGLGAALTVSLLMIGGAFVFLYSETKTLTDFTIIITAVFGGGIAGIFLFGMFTRRGDARAVVVGIVLTLSFTLYALLMQFNVVTRIFDPYYTAILGNIIMILVSYVASMVFPANTRDLTNLTVWDQTQDGIS